MGELAEKNTRDLVKRGDPRVTKAKDKRNPWWRPNKKKPIATDKMSKGQIIKYIESGKEL